MKTPASIRKILGRVVALLCLTGTAMAAADTPSTVETKSQAVVGPVAIQPVAEHVINQPAPSPTVPRLSPWTKEIVKLTQSGIEESVMVAFIDNSGSFELGADQIVYLNDIGVSAAVVSAMLQHDRELASGERLLTIVSEPPFEPLFPSKPTVGNKKTELPKPQAVVPEPTAEPRSAATPAITPAAQPAQQTAMHDHAETTSTFATAQPQIAVAKRSLYPVRDPHIVELMPPIVFFSAAEITPNTLIVYGP